MPKKGKRNKQEEEEESQRHSHFKRYVGLAISAYNLRRIGQKKSDAGSDAKVTQGVTQK
ncbi:MAG: hypothetical protein U9N86_12120 [Bacteroidota bacterium]|nr:hypothetical protein [Bacteroidota bacterium]